MATSICGEMRLLAVEIMRISGLSRWTLINGMITITTIAASWSATTKFECVQTVDIYYIVEGNENLAIHQK